VNSPANDPHWVDVYPVGVLKDLHHAWHCLTARKFPATVGPPSRLWRLSRARISLRYIPKTIARHIRSRDWRALKSTFNGYLAEPYHWPQDGTLTRCGSGWTRRRALRSLRRHGWKGHLDGIR
jgi:hypothetical protein